MTPIALAAWGLGGLVATCVVSFVVNILVALTRLPRTASEEAVEQLMVPALTGTASELPPLARRLFACLAIASATVAVAGLGWVAIAWLAG